MRCGRALIGIVGPLSIRYCRMPACWEQARALAMTSAMAYRYPPADDHFSIWLGQPWLHGRAAFFSRITASPISRNTSLPHRFVEFSTTPADYA